MELDQVTGEVDDYYIFNNLPNRYLHQTWWQSLEYGDELALLAGFDRTELRVAKVIIKLFRLTDGGKHKFNTQVEELLLLPEADISKLATYIGLCFTADNISQSILKAEKTEFKQQLGDEAYLFAHNDAQHLRSSCNITESYIINVKGTLMKNQMIGLHVLGKTLVHTDKALKRRLILKLGKPYEQFIRGTSSLKALSSSQVSCVSLVESVAQYLGFLGNPEQQVMTDETA
jgi:hypothetical protein